MPTFGQDIHVGNATLVFASSHTNEHYYQPAGWATPGCGRITDPDAAQTLCYRMSVLMGDSTQLTPRTRII